MSTGSEGALLQDASAGIKLHSPRGRWLILVTVLGSGMVFLDGTVVNVALPAIGRDLHASTGALQWVLSGYLLTLASLILLGGSLGDRFGRRRVFVIGAVIFTGGSLLCALAPSVGFLIGARVIQGVGGALLTPGSLAMLEAILVPADRPRGIGAWSGLTGVAAALGPLVGGYLITAVSWRAAFLINLPIGAFVVLFAGRRPREQGRQSARWSGLCGRRARARRAGGGHVCVDRGTQRCFDARLCARRRRRRGLRDRLRRR